MVDAFTWTKGNDMRTFSTRAELYEHMIAVGDVILEGDDAEKFQKHLENSKHAKKADAIAKIAKLRGE